mmetsp:Transcript_22718/g.44259  ORF Transcript_22718/g.44259 Transcript_22718/m.44259 type:complete len:345 (-) Transcript_22718:542-1576(-)
MVRQRSFGSCDVPVVGGIRREREVVGQGLVSVEYHRAIDLVVNSGVQPQGREDGFEGQFRHGVLQPECLHRYLAELELAVLRAPLGLADQQVAQGLVEDEEALNGAGGEPHEALRPRDVPHADRVDHGHEVGRDLEVLLQLVELLDELVDVGRGRDVGVVGDDGEHALGHARHRERQLLLDGVHGVLEEGLRLLAEQVVAPGQVKQPRPRPERPHGHQVLRALPVGLRCYVGPSESRYGRPVVRQWFQQRLDERTVCDRALLTIGDVRVGKRVAEESGAAGNRSVDRDCQLDLVKRGHDRELALSGRLLLHVVRHRSANIGLRAAGRTANGPANACPLDPKLLG